jgi:hypothetical protein
MAVVVGVVLLILAVDFLATVVVQTTTPRVLPQAVGEPTRWREVAWRHGPAGVCRELVLRVVNDRFTGHYDLFVPRSHAIHEAVRRGDAQERPNWFVHQVLGDVVFTGPSMLFADSGERDWYSLDFRPTRVLPDVDGRCGPAGPDRVLIRVPIVSTVFELRDQTVFVRGSLLIPERDLVTVIGDRSTVDVVRGIDPRATSGRQIELTRPVETTVTANAVELVVHPMRRRGGLSDVFTAGILALHVSLAAATGAIPLMLLLWLLSRVERFRRSYRYAGLRRFTAVILVVTLAAPLGITLLALTAGLGLWPAEVIADDIVHIGYDTQNGVGIAAALVAGATVLGPAGMLLGPGRVSHGPVWRRALPALAGLCAATAVALLGAWATRFDWAGEDLPTGTTYLAVAGATAVAYLGAYLVCVRWLRGWRAAAVRGAAALVAVAVGTYHQRLFADGVVGGVVVFAGAATVLVLSLAVAGGRLARVMAAVTSTGSRVIRGWVGVAAGTLTLALAGAPLVLLAWRPPPAWWMDPWGLAAIGQHVAALGFYLAVLVILVICAVLSTAPVSPPHHVVRDVGAVYGALTFFWTTEQLLYVPVSVLLGVLVTYVYTLPKTPPPNPVGQRAVALVERLVRERDAIGCAQNDLRPASDGSKYSDYARDQRALDDELRRIHVIEERLPSGGTPPTPTGGGWAHGVWGAGAAIVIAAPWIVIDLARTSEWSGDGFFLARWLVETIGWNVLQWPIYGFFFGYFYAAIRGRNGLAKAGTLFVTIVVPAVLYHAVIDQPTRWSGYLTWSVQALLFAALLGLVAGDRYLLLRVGLGWSHLFDVHRKRYVLGWTATALLAEAGLLVAVANGILPIITRAATSGGQGGP